MDVGRIILLKLCSICVFTSVAIVKLGFNFQNDSVDRLYFSLGDGVFLLIGQQDQGHFIFFLMC